MEGGICMIELFGKQYQLDNLIFYVVLILSIGIICLNIFYYLKFKTDILNLNMGIGVVLVVYSSFNLFIK